MKATLAAHIIRLRAFHRLTPPVNLECVLPAGILDLLYFLHGPSFLNRPGRYSLDVPGQQEKLDCGALGTRTQ